MAKVRRIDLLAKELLDGGASEEQAIVELLVHGWSPNTVAKKFGMTKNQIQDFIENSDDIMKCLQCERLIARDGDPFEEGEANAYYNMVCDDCDPRNDCW